MKKHETLHMNMTRMKKRDGSQHVQTSDVLHIFLWYEAGKRLDIF